MYQNSELAEVVKYNFVNNYHMKKFSVLIFHRCCVFCQNNLNSLSSFFVFFLISFFWKPCWSLYLLLYQNKVFLGPCPCVFCFWITYNSPLDYTYVWNFLLHHLLYNILDNVVLHLSFNNSNNFYISFPL